MTTKRNDILPSPGFSDDDSPPASNLSSMQRAIVTIQKLRSKVEHLERARTESIAIIGMACRFPGGANTPEAYFRLLEDGVDAVTEVPAGRWFLEQESADSEGEERSLRWGAFLKDVDQFDATFFGISPREAESLDPQQRLLLEVAWEGLERAGQLPERLMGSKTGVFVGIWSLDYQQRVIAQDQEKLDAYCFTGNVLSTAAGRLAYTFGFQGPCMSVETACSSSLTAIHLACQSLRQGESSLALACGVNLMLSPTTTKLLSKTQALSPDGRCKSFDARANGFVRGEGCGILVLKRLSDAERDGDTILALVRGSAINQDGRSTGLTAPNVLSQQALLRQALESARLSPQDIGYVETHGTGTSLGDPIEMEAIKAVLGAPREKGATCVIGAVKTNIGHLEAAAGVAGIIKVVLALQNEKIPGNLHFRSLNPRIDIKDTALEIAQVAKPWVPGIRPRFAGVSSFGISGTNAHVIIEEAPRNLEEALFEEETSTCLLPISAKTPEALRDQAQAFHEMLTSPQSPRLLDIVHTASSRRSHYIHRLSVVGSTREEMAEQLASFLKGDAPSGVAQGQSTPARAKVVFVFSGQGSQWLGMGRQLYETDSSFRSVIDTCDNLMTTRVGWSILDELDATEATSRVAETQVAQPLLFAIQIALVEMLRSWGISPDAMIGHSVGEIAAAHIAGILSLDEAIRLVALRGRIMQKATGMGKMVAVAVSPEEARIAISGYEDRVAIAAINDPGSVVLSGSSSAIDDIVLRCEKQGFVCRPLRVNYAFHSPQMDTFERELVERLVRVDTRRATLAMYSTVLADCVDGKELDVHYWGRNVRGTVDFSGAVFAAIRDGYQLFLEVGPHPVLMANIQQCFIAGKSDCMAAYTMRRNSDQRRTLLEAIGTLYTRGCAPEWARVVPNGGKIVPIPTYAWQRERFWIEFTDLRHDAPTANLLSRRLVHPLIGMALSSSYAPNVQIWEQRLGCATPGWIRDHVVEDSVVFPGAGYVEMAIAASMVTSGNHPVLIENITFERMLSLSKGAERTIQVVYDSESDSTNLTVSSRSEDASTWVLHASCHIGSASAKTDTTPEALSDILNRCTTQISIDDHYTRLESRGLHYGATFRGVQEVHFGDNECIALVAIPGASRPGYYVHPAELDACLQTAAQLAILSSPEGTILPIGISRLFFRNVPRTSLWVHSRIARQSTTRQDRSIDLSLRNEHGEIVAEIEGFTLRCFESGRRIVDDWLQGCLYRAEWRPMRLAPEPKPPGTWLVFGTGGRLDGGVVEQLRARGERALHVVLGERMERESTDTYTIDSGNPENYAAVVAEASRIGSWRGIVHLGAVEGASWNTTTVETLGTEQRNGSHSILLTVQAILHQAMRDNPRVWLVTRGAQSVHSDEGPGAVAHATIWGMAQTIALEHPELECSRIDIDPLDVSISASLMLVAELMANDHEDQVALRKNRRFVARLRRNTLPRLQSNTLPIHANASYLITGGLGGLGLSLAQWMVKQGARHLVLVGRNDANEVARGAIKSMQGMGAKIVVIKADVSQSVSVAETLAFIDAQMPPLRGVVHAAAILADHTALSLSVEDMERVLAVKLMGAFHLHALTAARPLDFFILYSSVAALFGSAGQANYAAANAAMDALARARRAIGLPAISIQWGPFSEVGLAAAQENRGLRMKHGGLESISPDEGLDALSRIGTLPVAELSVLHFDIRRWLEFHPQIAGSKFWSELRQEQVQGKKDAAQAASLRRTLEAMTEDERHAAMTNHFHALLGKVLHIDPHRINGDATLTSVGMDSLTSLELRNRLEATLELKLPATLLFTYPTSAAVVTYLLGKLAPIAAAPSDVVPTTTVEKTPGEEVYNADDDDLLAAFDASMTSIKDQGLV